MYSTQSAISAHRAAADVAVDVGLGVELLAAARSTRACRTSLVSTTPPQCVLTIGCRSGPMPFSQWYSSAKHPPGQRTTGTLIARSASTTSRADAALVRDAGIRAHPHALVDAAAQVLGELAVDAAVDAWLGVSAIVIMVSSPAAGVRCGWSMGVRGRFCRS